jgi:hypothetical protein
MSTAGLLTILLPSAPIWTSPSGIDLLGVTVESLSVAGSVDDCEVSPFNRMSDGDDLEREVAGLSEEVKGGGEDEDEPFELIERDR